MYVREYMSVDVITIEGDTLILEAEKIMHDHAIRRLPVVRKGKLVGLVTRDKLKEATGHHATSLTRWELRYLLSKMKVNELMETEVITVAPDTTIEKAMILAQKHEIGTLPVTENDRVIGILTTTDLYRIISQAFGLEESGARLHVFEPNSTGSLTEVIDIIQHSGATIRSVFHVTPPGIGQEDCIIHVNVEDASRIVDDLTTKRYRVEQRAI